MDRVYLESLFGLQGQVVVITGGGGILCSAMARALSRAGAKIALLDLSVERMDAVIADIHAAGGEAIGLVANVLDKESLQHCADEVVQHFGTVDVLLNGAGGNRPDATTSETLPFFDLPEKAFRQVFDINFTGMVLASQVFGRIMAEKGRGAILNIASINAVRPLTKIPAYSAAKAAVRNFTEWLAVHISQTYSPNIRVNAIAPGFFLTNQNRFLLLDEKTGEATQRGRQILGHTPMGRYGDPEELVATVIWLLSPGASFVHGAMIIVDGGFAVDSGV